MCQNRTHTLLQLLIHSSFHYDVVAAMVMLLLLSGVEVSVFVLQDTKMHQMVAL